MSVLIRLSLGLALDRICRGRQICSTGLGPLSYSGFEKSVGSSSRILSSRS
jgi:hypothetical protein